MVCDQLEGEVIWLPSHWWHETCGFDEFSVGVGGIVYPQAILEGDVDMCVAEEYLIDEMPYCQRYGCSSLYELHTEPSAVGTRRDSNATDAESADSSLLGYRRFKQGGYE